jgi:hypothetical protein
MRNLNWNYTKRGQGPFSPNAHGVNADGRIRLPSEFQSNGGNFGLSDDRKVSLDFDYRKLVGIVATATH